MSVSTNKDSVVITSLARTPQGKLLGALKELSAPQLGAAAIKAALTRSHLSSEQVNEVLMGCVLTAGIGQAPARQSALLAGLSINTACTTINKMCSSGMKSVMLAYDSLIAEKNSTIFIAGGMESMSNAPYLVPKGRQGYRMGHGELLDHMLWDGLEDAYDQGRHMGYFAEQCAKEYQFTREMQDRFAAASLERAQTSIAKKYFAEEIIPVTVKTRQGDVIVDTDEHPGTVKIEKIPQLSPAFIKEGTITAASSSAIADGAAAHVLMRLETAEKRGLTPLVRIAGHATHAKAPEQYTTAPIDAVKKLLQKINWTIDQVDLFEINEAFAVVPMAAMRELTISHDKLNVHGGGCALGHPIGASGARILVTLIAAMQKYNLKRGIAALCIGGGEAAAIAVEKV